MCNALQFCNLDSGGPVAFVWLVMVFLGWIGVRGTLLIWFWSLVGRSLLIRDRESVHGFKF